MKAIFTISTIVLFVFNAWSQKTEERLKLLISSRVDTSIENVRAVIKLYEDYYNSKPDSIYDNPYWNAKEKALYKDFDFSRASIFQGGMNAPSLFQYFSPFVMSVEPIDEKYQIRVLFSSPATDPQYAGSKVWCIQKLNAFKNNKQWFLENLMVDISKNWQSQTLGFIDYIYPPEHAFNKAEAQKAETFCQNFIQRFNPQYQERFKYYIASSTDHMGLLENFDYYFVGVTTGKAREGMLLTAKGNEHYPHEFVHKLLPKNPQRGFVIEEGLAEFLGTKADDSSHKYENQLSKLAHDIKQQPDKMNFESVVSQKVRFNGYQTAYPAGATICELVYQKKGNAGLNLLMRANTKTYDKLLKALENILDMSVQDVQKAWEAILLTKLK